MRSRGRGADGRGRGAARLAVVGVAGLLAVSVGGCAATSQASAAPITVTVAHGRDRVRVHVPPGTTVADVLRRAHVVGRRGQVRSVVRHRALGPNRNRPTTTAGGRPVAPDQPVSAPVRITVTDGVDTSEPVLVGTERLAAGGLPRALQFVQVAGRPGEAQVTTGGVSHEVVSRTVTRKPVPAHRATGKVVALSFDDGPDPRWTTAVLAILRQERVHATFCEVGQWVAKHPELTRQVERAGHQLCNHTEHHVEGLETQPLERVQAEMTGGRDALVAAGVDAPSFYRPPGGSLGASVYAEADALHEHVLYWSVDTRDWQRPPALLVAGRVLEQVQPGAIILLHDGGGDRTATLQALPAIIHVLRDAGYSFVLPITSSPEAG